MNFKSEIRDSTITGLLEKAEGKKYDKYLPKLLLKPVRGFNDETVTFDFPVTAIVGPNGGGKTTILGAAACAYKSIQPRRFFAKSGKYDEAMKDWTIEYEVIDRKLNPKDAIRRTASFKNSKWNRDALDRQVLVFGVSRTVPVNERVELSKCISNNFSVPESQESEFNEAVRSAVSRILAKDIARFKQLSIGSNGRVTLLTGKTKDDKGYSEFHFGAGESSVIRMVAAIEQAEANALILIEEIENGLHPVATVRMVEYLIDVASRKKAQAIFTTHSNDALRPLPSKAIWVATQDRIFQGKLDIHSLRAITGQIEAQLAIFVEDKFAAVWVRAILRHHGNVAVDHIEVHAMEGDGTAVSMNRYHNKNPAVQKPSVCIIDGDSSQKDSSSEFVYRLPGEAPESFVFHEVLTAWDKFGGKLSVALLQSFDNAASVKSICEEVKLSNMDAHVIYAQIGERLGLIPEDTVSQAFTTIWSQAYPDRVQDLLDKFVDKLPMNKSQ
jgi:predicted ATP-dependent endonuclease of OLD family